MSDFAAEHADLEALTGSASKVRLDALPQHLPAIPAYDLVARHPCVVAAEQAMAAAQENARIVRIQNRDNPQLGVKGINEKQPGTRWDTRFGVTL